MRILVLGAAAGGGVPQWNCGCEVCHAARRDPSIRRTQASLAISTDDDHWFLINASPDVRQQLTEQPLLHPKPGARRHSPIAGVILTNGEIDAVAGLLSMREGSPFTIYAHSKVLAILKSNSVFDVLRAPAVQRQPIAMDQPFEPLLPDGTASGLEITAFAVAGKAAWYLEGSAHPGGDQADGDTLGLQIVDKTSGESCYVIAGCAAVDDKLKARLAGAQLLVFDGTVFHDDELIAAGLGRKTGQDMGHIAMADRNGAIAALADLGIGRKIFLHINNSNRALLPESAERTAVERAGWQVAHDGLEVTL